MLKYLHPSAEMGLHPSAEMGVHCLAMVVAHVRCPHVNVNPDEVVPKQKPIKRQPVQHLTKPMKFDVQQENYDAPKEPSMPPEQGVNQVPPLLLLANQAIP